MCDANHCESPCLSGTPAEAGVRVGVPIRISQDQSSLSGTPAEAGVRVVITDHAILRCLVSVEPLPKQGCERLVTAYGHIATSLSGTPAEAGVRALETFQFFVKFGGLSGTPAEAGVRGVNARYRDARAYRSQWNPCRSRGARGLDDTKAVPKAMSQWNPCRSRGASRGCGPGYLESAVSVEPLPKQGCELEGRKLIELERSLSGTPAEAGVRGERLWHFDYGRLGLSGTPAEAGVRAGTKSTPS